MGIIRLVSIVALAVAFLGAAGVFTGANVLAWFIGGVLAYVVSATVDHVVPLGTRQAP